MAFSDPIILLAGLMEIVLPAHTILLCDGGFVDWPARGMFTAEDDTFGTLGSAEAVSETINDEAPGGRLTLLPPEGAEAADLFQTNAQGSPVRFWVAEVNQATGAIVGTPEMLFDGLVDTLTITVQREGRSVAIEFTAASERLFMVREGNALSPRFHKSMWPLEKGLDFATGNPLQVPWGTRDSGLEGLVALGVAMRRRQAAREG